MSTLRSASLSPTALLHHVYICTTCLWPITCGIHLIQIVQRQNLSAAVVVRVFHTDQPGDRTVFIITADLALHRCEINSPIRVVGNRSRVHAWEQYSLSRVYVRLGTVNNLSRMYAWKQYRIYRGCTVGNSIVYRGCTYV